MSQQTSTEWTAGPWGVKDGDTVFTADGKYIGFIGNVDVGDEQRAANARLIAAAPHMIHALEYVARWWDECGLGETWHPSIQKIVRAAIAKAREEALKEV